MLLADCEALRGAETHEAAEQRAERDRHAGLIESGRAIAARFPGQCAACGEGFPAGTPITLDKRPIPRIDTRPDAPVQWVAACCLDEQGRIRT